MTAPKITKTAASDLQPGDTILVTTASELATGWSQIELRTPWASDLKPARVRSDPDGGVIAATVKEITPNGPRFDIVTVAGTIERAAPKSPILRVDITTVVEQSATPPSADTTGLPDWIQPGAKVAEYSPRGSFSGATVTISTVDRFTNTQIVLDNGRRYRRETLRRIGDEWGPELMQVNDERVRNVRARVVMENANHNIGQVLRGRCGTVDSAAKMLDDLAALIEAARTKVARLQNPE